MELIHPCSLGDAHGCVSNLPPHPIVLDEWGEGDGSGRDRLGEILMQAGEALRTSAGVP